MKKGKAIIKWSLLCMSLVCVLSSSILVSTPSVNADMGGVTAKCAGHDPVSCSGYQCDTQDNFGCTCWNQQGQVVDKQRCPKTEDLLD